MPYSQTTCVRCNDYKNEAVLVQDLNRIERMPSRYRCM